MVSVPRSFVLTATQVKATTDIVEVARSLTKLRRIGKQFVGLCPLHQERNPSFFVQPKRQVFKCFGCGAGGDVIELVMHAAGCTFGAAIQVLAGFSSGVASASGPRSGPRFGASEGAQPLSPPKAGFLHSQFSQDSGARILAALDSTNRRLRAIDATNRAASAALATACEPDRSDTPLLENTGQLCWGGAR